MEQRNDKKNTVICLLVLCFVMTLLLTALHSHFMQTHAQEPMQAHAQEPKQLQELAQTQTAEALKVFRDKEQLLRSFAFVDLDYYQLDESPAGEAGYAVFFSVCDKISRADVYSGTGADLESAWQNAAEKTEAGIRNGGRFPVWVKADVVNASYAVSAKELKEETDASQRQYYRYGISLDESFHSALLEEELNGADIYEYEEGGLDVEHLNEYLSSAGREEVSCLPEKYTLFECCGWFCDEAETVHPLISEGFDMGHRIVDVIDREYAKNLIDCSVDYLSDQIREDGSFIYGIFPTVDQEIDHYNILRHIGALWSMVCCYRMNKDPGLKNRIEQTIDYMLSQIIHESPGTAYLLSAGRDEINLGATGLAIIALSEYISETGKSGFTPLCIELGEGILSMLDMEKGTYRHVLNLDFSVKEEFRCIFYDGEATFALTRLYALTRDRKWLDAACAAVDHFIEADYEQYKDHWVAYAVNDLTKYVEDRPEYYEFGLLNAWSNLQSIIDCETTHPTYLELLMNSFELYDRMVQHGMSTYGYDVEELLKGIRIRAVRQLNGFFYPEYAMYMANPQRILNAFMLREKSFRVRIDDVQHNIDGYYLYWINYDKLKSYGLHF